MSRKAAFFDIDGTIYREGLITEVFKKIISIQISLRRNEQTMYNFLATNYIYYAKIS